MYPTTPFGFLGASASASASKQRTDLHSWHIANDIQVCDVEFEGEPLHRSVGCPSLYRPVRVCQCACNLVIEAEPMRGWLEQCGRPFPARLPTCHGEFIIGYRKGLIPCDIDIIYGIRSENNQTDYVVKVGYGMQMAFAADGNSAMSLSRLWRRSDYTRRSWTADY